MELTAELADQFEKHGYFILQNFLPEDLLKAMRAEILQLQQSNEFRKAGIGKESDFKIDEGQRGDFICWIDQQNPFPASTAYIEEINALIPQLNRTFFLGINNYECHYAVYPSGTFYKRHSDRHKKSSPRVVSMVFYLNENWQPEDGGQLRIYDQDKILAEVLPQAGTLVIFLSETEHEVMPTHRSRMSLTGWMRSE